MQLLVLDVVNITTSTIAIDVKIAKGGADYFLAKGVSVPPNSAIELNSRWR